MRHLLENFIRIVVVLTNILPLNALAVYAASTELTPGGIEHIASRPLPFTTAALFASTGVSLSERFWPDQTALVLSSSRREVASLPTHGSDFVPPTGLSLSRPAALNALEALPAASAGVASGVLPGWFAPAAKPSAPTENAGTLPGWFAASPVPAPASAVLPG